MEARLKEIISSVQHERDTWRAETTRLREEVERLRAERDRYVAFLTEEESRRFTLEAKYDDARLKFDAALKENARLREALDEMWDWVGEAKLVLAWVCKSPGFGKWEDRARRLVEASTTLQSVTNTNPPAGADGGER